MDILQISNYDNNKIRYFCKEKLFEPSIDIKASDFGYDKFHGDINNLRVIHGTMEIANQMYTLTEGLKNIGVNAKTLNYYPNYLKYKSDYIMDINKWDFIRANNEVKNLASQLIPENDVFHFHYATSLSLDYSDLPLLKELGKKVVMHYWGSDIRRYSIAKKNNPYVIANKLNEDDIKRKMEYLSKFVDCCIVADKELYYYAKDFHNNIKFVPQAINLNNYKFNQSQNKNEKFLIVHAPTNRILKGTDYIIKAIENLQKKYDFEFKLVENMSHEEAKEIYSKADLIIDQLRLGGYGLFSLECMAMGKPVICWVADYVREFYPEELPIISASIDNIEQKLEFILNNKEMIDDIGRKGRAYVEQYHDYIKVAQILNTMYKELYI